MSYTLFLKLDGPLSESDFCGYFRARAHYHLSDGTASYFNEDTGVYFAFRRRSSGEVISFNMDYARPHIFGLEAVLELQAIVAHFHLHVDDDPQMGDTFSVGGFLKGWNAGNRAALSDSREDPQYMTLPARRIEEIWRWNLERVHLQRKVGEAATVPKITYLKDEGGLKTSAVWPDAGPVMLPEVDLVIVGRSTEGPDFALTSWEELSKNVLARYPAAEQPIRHHRLMWRHPPPNVASFVRSLDPMPPEDQLSLVDPDEVFNLELLRSP